MPILTDIKTPPAGYQVSASGGKLQKGRKISGLEIGCLGYQVNKKSGCRLSGKQDIRIIAILDAGFSLVRSELK